MKKAILLTTLVLLLIYGCGNRTVELTLEEIEALRSVGNGALLDKTISKPGPGIWEAGKTGGTWISSISNDPKTFNTTTARDADSRTVIDNLFADLVDYDPYKREFKPKTADFKVVAYKEQDRVDVIYTLRDDLFWTTPDGKVREQVTSDDVVFWYNEIDGDQGLQQPGYASQFVDMPDGSKGRVTIEKLDRYSFVFHFPRIIADPVLSSLMTYGPKYIYEPAKKNGGVSGVLEALTVETDVNTIPSMGPYHIVEYSPGVRVVLKRNPDYYLRDNNGERLPYRDKIIYKIVPDRNTEYLLFKSGGKDSYSSRPEDLKELVENSGKNYDVYNGGESLDSFFICFNQNPDSMNPVIYNWFSKKEFRQAMSSLLNRQRIANQVYRGMAVPATYLFAKANPMFDPDISNPYTYNVERAIKLLASIGIKQGNDGLMYDDMGNHIEFEFNLGAENNVGIDMANVFADELKQVGITCNVRPIDFQKVVQMLIETYDWEVTMAGLGANYWPSGGSNLWLSSGNFHLWHPLQESPATEWEERVDKLYNDGLFTLDPVKRKAIYDEYQRLLLEEQPMIYIVYPLSFGAFRHGWGNIFYDNLGVPDGDRIYEIY